ncbi:MAG: hypothetical protein DRH43_02055 [Deltaproteobacteria bacterium]|nr:MAG: hypothetical protein DRH43_02055 [Deltaproteobacteria bacterium]
MKNIKIQIYGNIADSLPDGVTWASIAYEDEFAVRERLTGKLLEDSPDLCLEIHTRPYYAYLMRKEVPKAVYFCNFPGGYFHNEALLDLYDFVFYDNIIGENYSRFHSNCCFLPHWMPDAFLSGTGMQGKRNSNELLGVVTNAACSKTWEFKEVQAILMKYKSLNGSWFLGEPGTHGVPIFLGVCFKADSVYVASDSSFFDLGREIGTGVFVRDKHPFKIVDEQKDKKFRQKKIIEKHLFCRRVEQILSFCFPDRK